MSLMPALPPGGLFEIVFSFDTTGSMSQVIDEVKGRLQDLIQRLQADIPGIRIGVIAHGDYCDRDVFYFEKHIDLTTNIAQLCALVQEVEGTGGGDPEECYEYVLYMTSHFSWTPGSQRALVLIGDATPHEPEYELNTENLDWRNEAENLANMGIKIYGVQAFENDDSTVFFEELVTLTSGQHLKLGQFSHICDFIMAICYRERGEEFLEGYEAEVRAREARGGLHKDLEGLFGVLRRGDSSASATGSLRKTSSTTSATLFAHPVPTPLSPISSVASYASKTVDVTLTGDALPPTAVVLPVSHKVVKRPVKVKTDKHVKNVAKNRNKRNADVEKRQRHTVPESQFILNQKNLARRWSRWTLAISTEQPPRTTDWIHRFPYRLFPIKVWKRRHLFPDNTHKRHSRALYEFSVQKRKGGKKCVVYRKWSKMGATPKNWESCLLGKHLVQKRIKTILLKEKPERYNLFVRRFIPSGLGKNQKKIVKSFNKSYTYLWDL